MFRGVLPVFLASLMAVVLAACEPREPAVIDTRDPVTEPAVETIPPPPPAEAPPPPPPVVEEVPTDTLRGISSPRADVVVLAEEEPLEIRGWYVSTQEREITVSVDDVPLAAPEITFEERNDVNERYPQYPVRQGWIVTVPAEQLSDGAEVVVEVEDAPRWEVAVRVGDVVELELDEEAEGED